MLRLQLQEPSLLSKRSVVKKKLIVVDDSGASVNVISEKNVRNMKIVSREPYVSSAGFFAANGSPVKMSERVKLEVTLQTVRNGETQNTDFCCMFGRRHQK